MTSLTSEKMLWDKTCFLNLCQKMNRKQKKIVAKFVSSISPSCLFEIQMDEVINVGRCFHDENEGFLDN
jgi:hypothetical protein